MFTRKPAAARPDQEAESAPYRICEVFVAREWRVVFDEVREVTRWPLWAFNRVREVSKRTDGRFVARTPKGEAMIDLRANVELGLLDHAIVLSNATATVVPCRVVPVTDGCVLTMTFDRPVDMPPHIFDLEMAEVQEELLELKDLLEDGFAVRP